MKLTKKQLNYHIDGDGEVTIMHIWTHRISEESKESIRVLEYPSHIERRRVTYIYFNDDILFFEVRPQLKKIIVPFGCSLVREDELPDFVTIEYK